VPSQGREPRQGRAIGRVRARQGRAGRLGRAGQGRAKQGRRLDMARLGALASQGRVPRRCR
jgi:hypothetical protein